MYEVSREVAVAFLFLSLKDPGHVPGVWCLPSSLHSCLPSFWRLTGAGDGAGFRCVLLCLPIMKKIKMQKKKKKKYRKPIQKVSLMCS